MSAATAWGKIGRCGGCRRRDRTDILTIIHLDGTDRRTVLGRRCWFCWRDAARTDAIWNTVIVDSSGENILGGFGA